MPAEPLGNRGSKFVASARIDVVRAVDHGDSPPAATRQRRQRLWQSLEGDASAGQLLAAVGEEGRARQLVGEAEQIVALGWPVFVDVAGRGDQQREGELAREELFAAAARDHLLGGAEGLEEQA